MLLYIQTGAGFVYNLERTLFAQVSLPDNRLYGGVTPARCNASIQISINHEGLHEKATSLETGTITMHVFPWSHSAYSLYSEL